MNAITTTPAQTDDDGFAYGHCRIHGWLVEAPNCICDDEHTLVDGPIIGQDTTPAPAPVAALPPVYTVPDLPGVYLVPSSRLDGMLYTLRVHQGRAYHSSAKGTDTSHQCPAAARNWRCKHIKAVEAIANQKTATVQLAGSTVAA